MAADEERSVYAAVLPELDDIFALEGRTKNGTGALALLLAGFGKSFVEHCTDTTAGSHELLPTGSQPKKNLNLDLSAPNVTETRFVQSSSTAF